MNKRLRDEWEKLEKLAFLMSQSDEGNLFDIH
jgi:hypothetical protein